MPNPNLISTLASDLAATVGGSVDYTVTTPMFAHCWTGVAVVDTYTESNSDFISSASNVFTFAPTTNEHVGTSTITVTGTVDYYGVVKTATVTANVVVSANNIPKFDEVLVG